MLISGPAPAAVCGNSFDIRRTAKTLHTAAIFFSCLAAVAVLAGSVVVAVKILLFCKPFNTTSETAAGGDRPRGHRGHGVARSSGLLPSGSGKDDLMRAWQGQRAALRVHPGRSPV